MKISRTTHWTAAGVKAPTLPKLMDELKEKNLLKVGDQLEAFQQSNPTEQELKQSLDLKKQALSEKKSAVKGWSVAAGACATALASGLAALSAEPYSALAAGVSALSLGVAAGSALYASQHNQEGDRLNNQADELSAVRTLNSGTLSRSQGPPLPGFQT